MARKGNTERYGVHLSEFNKHRNIIIKRDNVCAICGQPVDKKLKYPHPFSATVDHIIPLAKGGHPSDINNLQLAHFRCNRMKSDSFDAVSLEAKKDKTKQNVLNNRDLKKVIDWETYRA